MLLWGLGITALICAAIAVRQYRAQRAVYRPMSARQPERRDGSAVPLGMEATDLDHVRATMRRNESLERANTNWTSRKGGFIGGAADTDIAPLADDETYAARFHAAFQKDNTKDTRHD